MWPFKEKFYTQEQINAQHGHIEYLRKILLVWDKGPYIGFENLQDKIQNEQKKLLYMMGHKKVEEEKEK